MHNIPIELQQTPQWVLWQAELRKSKKGEEKITKVPYQFDGMTKAAATRRNTWSSYPTIINNIHRGDGIGFVFSSQDKFVGVDIDECVVDGVPNDFAQNIIDYLDSYTELSPSGTGIHIITTSDLIDSLGHGKKNDALGLEIYANSRFFTMTGNVVQNKNKLNDATETLQHIVNKFFPIEEKAEPVRRHSQPVRAVLLSDDELLSRMFSSANGGVIQSLYNGELINDDHSESDLALCNHLAFWTDNNANKIDALFRESGLMREKWDSKRGNDTYGNITINKAIAGTPSTVSDAMIEQDDYAIRLQGGNNESGEQLFMLSELGNAERIAYKWKNDICYLYGNGWYVWNGKHWEFDASSRIEVIVSSTLRELHKSTDAKTRNWAKQCEKRSIRTNTLRDLKPLVPKDRTDFNLDDYLFNANNGTIDLRTGDIRPHDKNDLITHMSPIDFVPDAQCPTWDKFMDDITCGDKDLNRYLQKALGYSLSGNTSEQVVFFMVGAGANGKSTLIETIDEIIGTYFRQTNTDTFIRRPNASAINNDVARLHDARFVAATESEEGQSLQEALIKQLTGGEKIAARFLGKEFFEFKPRFKVFFATNHKPIIKGTDKGIWRRIRLIPFNMNLREEDKDRLLIEKIKKEHEGILQWLIRGFTMWLNEGLKEPKAVLTATADYKEEMDILQPFIDECCEASPMQRIEAKNLYIAYERFCNRTGETTLKNRAFYRIIEMKGYKREKGTGNKTFIIGIGLKKEFI